MTEINSNSSKSLPIKHAGVALDDAIAYMDKRRKGEVKSLDTGFPKLNKAFLGGLD